MSHPLLTPKDAQLIEDIKEYLSQERFKLEKYESLLGHQLQQLIHQQTYGSLRKEVTRFQKDHSQTNIELVLRRLDSNLSI